MSNFASWGHPPPPSLSSDASETCNTGNHVGRQCPYNIDFEIIWLKLKVIEKVLRHTK